MMFFQPVCDHIADYLDLNDLSTVRLVNKDGRVWGSRNYNRIFGQDTILSKKRWFSKHLSQIAKNPNCISPKLAEHITYLADNVDTPISLRIMCLGAKMLLAKDAPNAADLRLLKTFAAEQTLLPYVCCAIYPLLQNGETEQILEWLKADSSYDYKSCRINFRFGARQGNLQKAQKHLEKKKHGAVFAKLCCYLKPEDNVFIKDKILYLDMQTTLEFAINYAIKHAEYGVKYISEVVKKLIREWFLIGLKQLLPFVYKSDTGLTVEIIKFLAENVRIGYDFDRLLEILEYLCQDMPTLVRDECFKGLLARVEEYHDPYITLTLIEHAIRFYMLKYDLENPTLIKRISELEKYNQLTKNELLSGSNEPWKFAFESYYALYYDYSKKWFEDYFDFDMCNLSPEGKAEDFVDYISQNDINAFAKKLTALLANKELFADLNPIIELCVYSPTRSYIILCEHIKTISQIGSYFNAADAYSCLIILQNFSSAIIHNSIYTQFTGCALDQFAQKDRIEIIPFVRAILVLIPRISEVSATTFLQNLVENFTSYLDKDKLNEQFIYFLIINLVHHFPTAIGDLSKKEILDKILTFFPNSNSNPDDPDFEYRSILHDRLYPFESPKDLFPRGIDGQVAYEKETDHLKQTIMHAVSVLWPYLSAEDQERCCTELTNKQLFHCQADNPVYQNITDASDRKLQEYATTQSIGLG